MREVVCALERADRGESRHRRRGARCGRGGRRAGRQVARRRVAEVISRPRLSWIELPEDCCTPIRGIRTAPEHDPGIVVSDHVAAARCGAADGRASGESAIDMDAIAVPEAGRRHPDVVPMKLPCTTLLLLVPTRSIPQPLPEMTLPWPRVVPPIVLLAELNDQPDARVVADLRSPFLVRPDQVALDDATDRLADARPIGRRDDIIEDGRAGCIEDAGEPSPVVIEADFSGHVGADEVALDQCPTRCRCHRRGSRR